MDETNLSWRARLAKSNINILNIALVKTDQGIVNRWFVEFTYHPKPGTFKWCKTYIDIEPVYDTYSALDEGGLRQIEINPDKIAGIILDKVLALRKELED